MLGKVIKNDVKNMYLLFLILFAAAIIIPILVYTATTNLDNELQSVFRGLCVAFVPISLIVAVFALIIKNLESDFTGKTSYLIQTLPVKVSDLLISKTMLYVFWTIISWFIALVSGCLTYMDFSPFADVFKYIYETILMHVDKPSEYVLASVTIFRVFLTIIAIFGFGCASMSFGHLFGTKKTLGELLFAIGFILLMTLYSMLATRLVDFNSTLPIQSYFYYADTVVEIAVTAGFFIFTNYVFTKKINIL
jgi:hypothetical protein